MAAAGIDSTLDRSVISALVELGCLDRGDWTGTIQHILRVDARVLDVDRVSYWAVREEPLAIVCEMAYQRDAGIFERGHVLLAADHAPYFEAIHAAPVNISDCRSDPRARSLREYLENRRIMALLDFPVWVRARVTGVLCHEHVGEPRVWSSEDVHFAGSIAQVIACSLAAQDRVHAEQVARQAAFLDNASRVLGKSLEPEEVASSAVAVAVPALADAATIHVIEDGVVRRLAFYWGTVENRQLADEASLENPVFLAGGGGFLPQRAMARADSVLIPRVTDAALARVGIEPDTARFAQKLGIGTGMAVPLFVAGHVMGAMSFYGVGDRRFGADDLHLAEQFAARFASALENARLHQRVRAAVRVRDEFISLAAHELNTPVTALQLAAEGLARRAVHASREDVARTADRMAGQVKRLARLIRQMLDASRIAGKVVSVTRERLDLAEVVREMASTLEVAFERAGCALTVRADAPVIGEWDRMRIEQCLSGLLDNAMKFGAGKPVEVSASAEGDVATLIVRDHGPGLPPHQPGALFDAFERGVSAEHYGGLGLGLYIAKAAVDAHGGMLDVESKAGEGATFTVRLPLRAPAPR
jgi:signal transduction histidine kinase